MRRARTSVPRALATAIVAWVALLSCGAGAPVTGPPAGDGLKILFVGNSLTYANDLPGIVEAIGVAAGTPIATAAVAYPNYALEDHWGQGDALRAIDAGGWDYVVLQQGPSSLPESRANLVEWSGRFAERIAITGARPVLFMVWPEEARQSAFDDVRESYAAAARATGAVFVPAGEAWRAVWESEPDLALYSADGFHPSLAGSVVAALALWAQLTGGNPVGLPAAFESERVPRIEIEPALAARIQAAVAEAQRRYGNS